jgi:hypothetical protein
MSNQSNIRVSLFIISLGLLVSSQFVQLFRGYNAIDLISLNIIFIIPMISSVVLLIGLLMLIYLEFRKYSRNIFVSSIITFAINLLLNIQFIIYLVSNHSPYIWNSASIYLNLLSFLFCFFGIIVVSSMDNPDA